MSTAQKVVWKGQVIIMQKNLTLVKPNIGRTVIRRENLPPERITFLDIPEELNLRKLKSDIRSGAVQFKELVSLLEKKNQPRYILITASDLEQGYMAVTYLAATYNNEEGLQKDFGSAVSSDEAEAQIEEWEEDPFRIPVVEDSELKQSLGDYNNPFGMGDYFVQGNQRNWSHEPYWMGCTHDSVCVVSHTVYGGFGGFGGVNDEGLYKGLQHFRNNKKVYILNIDETLHGNWESDEEDEVCIPWQRQKWNNIALSYAADEVLVDWKQDVEKDEKKEYFRVLFKTVLRDCGLTIPKNFPVDRVVNLVLMMEREDKCQLVENIITYAIKDWEPGKKIVTKQDFDFMDRFARSAMDKSKNNGRRSFREKMMQELVGLDSVKEQVLNVVNVMKYNRMREQMKIGGGGYHNVHLMLGAPGTAKTTVAMLMGRIMVEEKLLPDDRFVCVNGAELKGMYVGHSAPKTKALFEENDIIVIDEAYSIVGDRGESDSFSKEAIAQLIIELEEHSKDKLVIFAGYGGKKVSEKNNKMKDFLDANPGIKSRITSTIYFDSYNEEEMTTIFFQIAKNQNYIVDSKTTDIVKKHFAGRVKAEDFGNGREARSLLENAVVYAAKRLFAEKQNKFTSKDVKTIKYEDVEQAIRQVEEADLNQTIHYANRVGFL